MTLTINNHGRIGGFGTLDANVDNTGTIYAQGGTYEVTGTVEAGSTSSLGLLEVDPAGVLQLDGPVSGQTLTFLDNTGQVTIGQIGSFSVTRVDGFAVGDKFFLPGHTNLHQAFNAATGLLTISDQNNVTLGTLTFSGTHTASDFNGAIVGSAPCFATGTRILTATGETAVESLAVGDLVQTQFAGLAPIIWIGHRTVDCRRHPRPHDVLPVRVRRDAFGANSPSRDLVLSPDHAVLIDAEDGAPGILVPIRYLLNGITIAQEPADSITYWHVELRRHDVLLAEGLPAESYLDTGNRSAFANGGTATMLHADFALRIWKAKSCARLLRRGPRVTAARLRLMARATELGHAVTGDEDVRMIADGREILPEISGRTLRFQLPPGACGVRLISRNVVPSDIDVTRRDRRRLGIAVAKVVLDGRELPLNDPRLSSGWHPPEYEPGHKRTRQSRPDWRWTDGDAGLALAGARTLDIVIAMTERYWQSTAA